MKLSTTHHLSARPKTMNKRLFGIAFGLAFLACSGSAPPPDSPAAQPPPPAPPPALPAAAPAQTPSASDSASATPAAGSEPAPAAPAKPAASPEIPRSPKAILVARDVSFLVEYAKSDPKKTAEADCEKKSKGDAAKRAECIDKARNDFKADVLRFQENDKGACTLVIYKRTGDNLSESFRGPLKLVEQPPDKVSVGFSGGKGQRPLFKGNANGLIVVPDDYSIEIDDPQLGKLYYTAKVGLVQDPD